MVSYFDVVPEDILTVIFMKIVLPDILYSLIGTQFVEIMKKARIWKEKLLYVFTDVTWPLVPASLTSYEDNEVIKSLYMYDRFYWSYDAAMEIYHELVQNRGMFTFNLSSINNFDVLTLKYTKRIDPEKELIIYNLCKYINKGMRNIEIDKQKMSYVSLINSKIQFSLPADASYPNYGYTYDVSLKDIFNLLIHSYCNGLSIDYM